MRKKKECMNEWEMVEEDRALLETISEAREEG
jgi:hypothetical protein